MKDEGCYLFNEKTDSATSSILLRPLHPRPFPGIQAFGRPASPMARSMWRTTDHDPCYSSRALKSPPTRYSENGSQRRREEDDERNGVEARARGDDSSLFRGPMECVRSCAAVKAMYMYADLRDLVWIVKARTYRVSIENFQ